QIIVIGYLFAVSIMIAKLEGKQECEEGVRKGHGNFIVILSGITLGYFPVTRTKSNLELVGPGIFGPNPLTLTGPAAYINLSALMPTQESAEGPFFGTIILGMGMPPWIGQGGKYEGWDFGYDYCGGISIMLSGKGPE
ncbi:MAG: hypothetical protein P8078_09065, partial [bacterium]